MGEQDQPVELQEAVEGFLEEARRRRPESVYKRFTKTMELFQTFLAVELLDPEEPTDGRASSSIRLSELTPDILERFLSGFLPQRSKPSNFEKHVQALEAFLRFVGARALLAGPRVEALQEVVRRASSKVNGPEDNFVAANVVRVQGDHVVLYIVDRGEVTARVGEAEVPVQENHIYPVHLQDRGEELVASFFVPGIPVQEWEGPGEEDDEGAWGEDDLGEDGEFDGELPVGIALAVLSELDRLAPRLVVEAVLADYDEARETLLQWLYDDKFRNLPEPGAGEAPAHAARILSEMGEKEIAPRLLSLLGVSEPVGEEAPVALARLGPAFLRDVRRVAEGAPVGSLRRRAALWSLGFFAARHPATRQEVIRFLVREVLEGGDVAEALRILVELRAVEAYPKLRKASRTGDLDLERHGYTIELLHDELRADYWGENLQAAHIPVLFLYPTAEEIEEIEDFLFGAEDPDDWEEEWEEDEAPGEELREGGWGRVIPFPPNGQGPEDGGRR